METRFGHDFSKIPVHPGRKLSGSLNSLAALASRQIMLSNPGDACEQEADRAASLVVKNGDSVRSPRVLKERQRPPFEKGSSEGPLDTAVGESLEPNFGYDFSAVRVHTNAKAAASARALHADAYAIGRDIVFAEGRYTPQTSAGRFLLAHELAHVVQQANHPGPAIMRRGVTFRGFLANIFHFWDYSKETLDEYLHVLDTTGQTVGDDDSDDMARQVANEWKVDKSRYALTPKLKVLLIREMLDGHVSERDQKGILTLLEGSTNSDLTAMIGPAPNQITYDEIHAKFDDEKKHLELFNARVLTKLKDIKAPDPTKGESVQEVLEKNEREAGIAVQQISLSFHLAPGRLLGGFWANIDVPENGVEVTITLTRTKLTISIYPGILIDVIGPFNATLTGYSIQFQGLKSQVEVDRFSKIGNQKINEYIRGDLLAGTRFADPNYDPMRDPYLISEIKDPNVIGDINRIKYNIEKNSIDKKGSSGAEQFPDMIQSTGARIYLTHTQGMKNRGDGWGVEILPGTGFSVALAVRGTGSEIMKRDVILERLTLDSSGIFIVKGQKRIFKLYSVTVKPGFKFELGRFEEQVDIKEFIKKEYPGKFSEAVTDIMNFIGAKNTHSLLQSLAEFAMSFVAPILLDQYWGTIRDILGMSDKQLRVFLGERDADRD